MKNIFIVIAILLNLLFLGMCMEQNGRTGRRTPSNSHRTSTNRPARNNTRSARPKTNIKGINVLDNGDFGKHLTNEEGFSLYVDTSGEPGTVNCMDACTKIFKPAIVKMNETIKIHESLKDDLVGMIKRDEGFLQITYNRYPLYYYKNDTHAEEVEGQGYNGTWYLLNDKGRPIKPGEENSTDDTNVASGEPNNATATPTATSSSDSSSQKGLFLTGMASLLIVPDRMNVYIRATIRNADLAKALSTSDSLSTDLNNLINKLNPTNEFDLTKLSLVEKQIQFSSGLFYVSYDFIISTGAPELLDKIKSLITQLRTNDVMIAANMDYSFSNELYNQSKNYLYSMALRNAMDNAQDVIAKLGVALPKKNSIKSITVDTSNLQPFSPILMPDTNSFYPIFKKIGSIVFSVKTTLGLNILNKK
jgi:predicted lipoprotein with Yx(FWY)xxD motif